MIKQDQSFLNRGNHSQTLQGLYSNMTELSPEQVAERFGKMFCRSLLTLVDERGSVVEIIEECSARGPVEWDLVNRLRAGGAVYSGLVDGTTLILRARIGRFEVRFGPADFAHGGQALEAVEVEDDQVRTFWMGAGGAGLGLAACLAQAPGVMKAIYPSEDDLTKVGGQYVNRVVLETPKYRKLIFAVDNTDVKDKGATWSSTLKAGKELCSKYPEVKFLAHRIFQAYPGVSWKTTNNVAVSLSFALPFNVDIEQFLKDLIQILERHCYSNEACAVAYDGIVIPEELKKFAWKVKGEIVDLNEASKLAEEHGVKVLEITGRKGVIGALAALALYDAGLEYAALKDDPALRRV